VNDEHEEKAGRYVGTTEDGKERLWWQPPHGFPAEALPVRGDRSPDGPSWGFDGNGPAEAAKTILLHATADATAAESHHHDFMRAFLTPANRLRPLGISAPDIEEWLGERRVDLAPGWGPLGPGPTIRHVAAPSDPVERYTVALDGWDVLAIELPPVDANSRVIDARIAITDLAELNEYCWDQTVAVTEPGEDLAPHPQGERVNADALPFGGWAIQVDGSDVVIVERQAERGDALRVAVYDRAPGSEFLLVDKNVRYRQLPAEPRAVGERLRQFAGTSTPTRLLGR
jgi:hypothetical protein